MRKAIIALLVCFLLVACQPVEKAPETEKTEAPVQPKVETEEKTVEKEAEAAPPEVEKEPEEVDIEQACGSLISVEEFARICELDPKRMTGTEKATERTCWVTFVDRMDRKYTAGFNTVDWIDPEEANSELDRGINMRRKDEETDVGERNYKYPEIERENIVWVRGSFLTSLGASTELCTKEQLAEVAKAVDSNLH